MRYFTIGCTLIALFCLGMFIYGSEKIADNFKKECEKIQGTAVWDGLAWQCLRPGNPRE